MSGIVTLADVGYRQLDSLPGPKMAIDVGQIASIAQQRSDYEVAGTWIRRRGRKRGGQLQNSITIIDIFDKKSDLTDDRLGFIEEHFHNKEFNQAELRRVTTDNTTLHDLVQMASKKKKRWRGMHHLTDALYFAGRQRLRPLFRDSVAPCFFDLYPEGRIAVLRYDLENDDAAAFARVLYSGMQTPLTEIAKRFPGIRTLQDWHLTGIIKVGPLLITIFNNLFYPFIGGFRGGPPGLDFLFMFEPAERYKPGPFPRNWLAAASSVAEFGRERVDFYPALSDPEGPAWSQAVHQRLRHDKGYTVCERLALLNWYVGQANRLLYELADVANFTESQKADGLIDPVFAFEHYLTVDRLLRQTLLAMSLQEPGLAKYIVFEIADLYDGLSDRFGNNQGGSTFFKKLFNTKEGPELLRDRLRQIPSPFGTELNELAERTYSRLEKTVVDSVWLRDKVTPTGIKVRGADLGVEDVLPYPDFVAELMRAYRNAHHGYFTAADRQKRPSRFLYLVDGNLPSEITTLPVFWFLAYLADPQMVGWKHLGTGCFE